ncbi:Mth938-like domain-containing protein [Polycladidibacter stylochi]|uniref:Mth938-like domain-containing protein n=1 Tax=Polycladidibacter stylochi TaxID=1807766 RepID=UPI00082DA5BF|nr:MTH938/NDUFAF3 family protein [Pseudovibrio stylochi]
MAGRGKPEIRFDAHLPEQVQIDAYGDNGFRFAGMSHRGSLLCLPSGLHGWDPKRFSDITAKDFDRVFIDAPQIEVLLIGSGPHLLPFPEERKAKFRQHGIMVDSMSTGAAVRTYNVLLAEKRAIAAAFIAVE